MDKNERNLIINIEWKPFLAAIMTMGLIRSTELLDILIGVTLGIASALACYLDLRKFIKSKEKRD